MYGPSPFYWDWEKKFELSPTAGDYYYDKQFEKYFLCRYLNHEDSDNRSTEFLMYYNNAKLSFVPKENISLNFLPVLGSRVACSLTLKPQLEQFILNSKLVVKKPIRKNNTEVHNRKILNLWLNGDFDENDEKIKLLCFFHDDHNPSAVYNFKTNYFKCYACQKCCRNLYLHLKKIDHDILKQL